MTQTKDEIPNSWKRSTLGEVADFIMGQAPPGVDCNKFDHGTVFVKAGEFGETYPVIREWTTKPLKFAKSGDVLICVVRATAGKLNLGTECAIGRSVAAIRPLGEISPNFVLAQLKPKVEILRAGSVGSAQGVISKVDLANIDFSVPPLNEQRRIVAEIEALMARSQQVKEALEAIPSLLNQFRQSVLAAAFRGDLTADWREKNPDVEPASELIKRISKQLNKNLDDKATSIAIDKQLIPDKWTWTQLNLVIKNIQAGKNFSCPEIPVTENTVGLVKISAVTWEKFDERETKTVVNQSRIDPTLFIQEGDFLISRANTIELVGASVVVEEINYKIMISDKVWRVKFLDVEDKYINFYLKSNGTKIRRNLGSTTLLT